jgi:hypothetical protein
MNCYLLRAERKVKTHPARLALGGFCACFEDAYFDSLIRTPTPGYSNSSGVWSC